MWFCKLMNAVVGLIKTLCPLPPTEKKSVGLMPINVLPQNCQRFICRRHEVEVSTMKFMLEKKCIIKLQKTCKNFLKTEVKSCRSTLCYKDEGLSSISQNSL